MTDTKPDFVIEEAPAVAFGKPKAVNAYLNHVKALLDNAPTGDEMKGKAITFHPYPVEGREMDSKQLFEYVVRKIRPEIPVKYTVRSLLREDGRVSLWLVPKIERVKKEKESPKVDGDTVESDDKAKA